MIIKSSRVADSRRAATPVSMAGSLLLSKLLMVEDNAAYASLVMARLEKSGFKCDLAASVAEAELAISKTAYRAILLDLGLPDHDGAELLKHLRSRGDAIPVLIATARAGLEDRVEGLRSGADDYIAKPFALDELVARLHALLRRPHDLLGKVVSAGNLSFDTEERQFKVDGLDLPLRGRELAILELLIRHKGCVVRRHILEDQLFGASGVQALNTIEVYVHRLRTQLADIGATTTIHTVRGIGYLLSDSAPHTP